jgi:hypothetical protein
MQSLYLQVLEVSQIDEILEFEKKKLEESIADEMDRQLHSWNARWRRESLEHYIPMGWSFVAREENKAPLLGYLLAQPLIFFDGQTQTLWIEHLQFQDVGVRDALCEVAVKLAREKHLQKVLFNNEVSLREGLATFKPETWAPNVLQIRTTKT